MTGSGRSAHTGRPCMEHESSSRDGYGNGLPVRHRIAVLYLRDTMSHLKKAVAQMEQATQAQGDHLRDLRHWRLQAERRFMTVVVQAAKVRAEKGKRK